MGRLVLVIASLAVAAVSLAARDVGQLPPKPSAPQRAPVGEFVWHDLATDNPASVRAFYSALFGWTFTPGDGIDPGYTMIVHEGVAIGGIVQLRDQAKGTLPQWIAYVAVENVDKTAESVKRAGGQVARGPLNARSDLRVALVIDPQGAPLGLASRPPLVPAPQPPGMHHWLWMDYVARDAPAALTFYSETLGFTNKVSDSRDKRTYHLLLATDRPRAGLFTSPWTRETSAWLPYVRVADPAAMAAQVEKLGGRIVLAPRPEVRNGSLAIVLDPSGAALALQKYPFETGATP